MRNAFRKDIFREIKNTFGRFLAIFAIVALGVAFFSGLGSTGADMKLTGDGYFDAQKLMDLRVISTYGLNANDVAAIERTEGVESVYPAYGIDAQVTHNFVTLRIRVHSIGGGVGAADESGADAANGGVNQLSLIAGRLPQAENEAVAEAKFLSLFGYQLGDTFTLESGKKTKMRNHLKNIRYRIVGIVSSPFYVSYQERGASSIGDGLTNMYMMIPESNFRQREYSEAFVTVRGARALPDFDREYTELVASVSDALEATAEVRASERFLEVTEDAYSALAAKELELAASAAGAEDELLSAQAELTAAREELAATRRDLILRQAEVSGGVSALSAAREQLRSGIASLDDAIIDLETQETALSKSIDEIGEGLLKLDENAEGLIEQEALARVLYAAEPAQLRAAIDGLSAARQTIVKNRAELLVSLDEANDGIVSLHAARAELVARRGALSSELSGLSGDSEDILAGEGEIAEGLISVAQTLKEIDLQISALSLQETATEEQLALARSQILASRKTLDALDKPQWYVLDRDANPGYAGFSEDSDKIEAIGRVFPAIFFIVAALVSLTTMTRLVEERRIEIGTLKSLGYGNLAIMSKYILYAAAPTVLGGLAGGYFGMQFFPVIIISAYSMLYAVPYPVTPLHIPFWMTGIVIGALSTLIATIAACENELRASPSTLMRPKSPKLGKRILLERIPLLWRSLSFIQKVTVRNIFRYKKRFFMTIVGVAGCTALLMTGFGLRDSVTAMLDLQFVEINRYDLTTTMTDTAKASDLNAVVSLLAGDDFVRGNMPCRRMTYDAGSEQPGMNARAPVSVTLVVPQDAETFHEYIVLRDRTTHAQLPFGASVAAPGGSGGMEGAVITEKLASLLGLVPGDSFFITDEDGVRIDILVSGITENYYAHYVYMTAALYTQLLGQAPEYNCVYTFLSETTLDDRIQLAGKVLNRKGVNAIYYTSAISETFQEVITNLNFVVLVLILSAAALAFVVLLNLTSINISERIRELATIEVLGFYDREVSAYVYRENIALTVIGAGIGLLLGVALHLYVVVSTETELMMFGRKIRPESFVYSVLLTLIFSICVNILTGKRLRSINMVEALKSVE